MALEASLSDDKPAATSEPIRFDGKVAIVTGAGRGLGRSHALLLARLGAAVVVNDLGVGRDGNGSSPDPAESVGAEIEAAGGVAMVDFSDVTSFADAQQLVESTTERFGRLDIVVSNAGITETAPFAQMTPEQFDRMVRSELYGTFNIVRCAWSNLQMSGHGRVVLTISNAGPYGGPNAHFAAAKFAVVGLGRSLAVQGRSDGIGVNMVAPAGMTRLLDKLPEDLQRTLEVVAPPAAVSPLYAWLAHESCKVSGEIFAKGGGRTVRYFIGQTPGYIATGAETAEDVRDHRDEFMEEAGYWVPQDLETDSDRWKNYFLSAAEALVAPRPGRE